MTMKKRILIADDEQAECVLLSLALKKEYEISIANTAADCLNAVRNNIIDVVLLDLVFGPSNGLTVLKDIKSISEDTIVIMITAYGSIKSSVEAMSLGAFTYLTKPIEVDELKARIAQALENRKLSDEVKYLSGELQQERRYREIIGDSAIMKEIYHLIDQVKNVSSNVTIYGESGTGKELAARAIHFGGLRAKERFVTINCAAIPENLLEDEFFGHKKGSFTGAVKEQKGKFEIADGGTVFLDEIGDMPLSLQGKILRAIQYKEFTPIGGDIPVKVNIRIIAATNKNLKELVEAGRFREDLYYRLNVFTLTMPPLRKRKEDIPDLCEYFIKKYNAEMNKSIDSISSEAMEKLQGYEYPGNVRQLSNIIEHAMILEQGRRIEVSDLPGDMTSEKVDEGKMREKDFFVGKTFSDLEKKAIIFALERNNGRRDITASQLGISIRTLHYKMHTYGIE